MIAVDTSILVYSHRSDSAWHEAADASLASLAESSRPWAIPWPCVHEFLAIATHPRIFDPPSPVADALQQVECWREAPGLTFLGESSGYWGRLRPLVEQGRILGGQMNARAAAAPQDHPGRSLYCAPFALQPADNRCPRRRRSPRALSRT